MAIKFIATSITFTTLLGLAGCGGGGSAPVEQEPDTDPLVLKQDLGKRLFSDTNLSTPPGQSCASCHEAVTGFADPDSNLPVSQGVHLDRFGNRNAPTVAYAVQAPEFHFDQNRQKYIGGQFVDGRAANLAEQAKQPFLNPLEMANPDKFTVVQKIRDSDYADLFEQVYGVDSLNDTETAFDQVADAIATFEKMEQFSPFTSKFDFVMKGEEQFTEQERRGFQLFDGKGQCFVCHQFPLSTDHSYSNLGVPKNPDNPFYTVAAEFNPDGSDFVDWGLGANPNLVTAASLENGKFKVPTLRNVAITAPYMHNGVFKTLEEVVNFYNTRDVLPRCGATGTSGVDCWPAPEVAENVDTELLGNLGLTNEEVADLVAFLKTLTDGYVPPQ
ncbi:MAG TPA: cytochrome-c peroxidase [Chromatiales bacterium]|nr:cytochrome-c peroxidase [Thiotrichales bacterium]HIP68187.1 cytochrome-c peroxidase [Chromatiales bacterium]